MAEYSAAMRAVIDQFTDPERGPYSIPAAAQRIVEHLQATDPDLLNGWLHQQATEIVRIAIRSRDQSMRSHARATSGRSVFRAALDEAHRTGSNEPVRRWLDCSFTVNSELVRKRLADMDAPELTYVAGEYHSREISNRMMKQFLTALASRIGDGRVEDYFDENQLSSMWNSLTSLR